MSLQTLSGHDKAKIAKRSAPSEAARSRDYSSYQGKPSIAIYNGFFVSDEYGGPKVITIAPPVQIFHPVFQQFLDRIDDPTFAPDEEVVARVSRLMPYSSRLHPSGDDAPVKLRGHLAVLLQGHMMQGMLFDPRSPGGVVARHEVNRTIPLITFEYRRSICEGGCGPTVQAAYYLKDILSKNEVRAFRTFRAFTCRISDVVFSSGDFSTCLVVRLSYLVAPALICPYTAWSLTTSSLFSI